MFREEDHPRDGDGKFSEKGGERLSQEDRISLYRRLGKEAPISIGEKRADEIKQYSDNPARDLAAAGLPSGETIRLSRQEYAILRAEVVRKNAAQRGKVKPVNHAFTANYFYVYSTRGGDGFTVMKQYDIETQGALIDMILRGEK